MSGPKLMDDPKPKEPPPKCEFTPKQRHDVYRAFLKMHEVLTIVRCGTKPEEPLCALHRSALAAIAPMVQVLAGGDGDVVLRLMRLHKDTHPGITMPNLMKAVAAALAEGTNGKGR